MTDRDFEDSIARLYRHAPESEAADAVAAGALRRVRRTARMRMIVLGASASTGLAVLTALLALFVPAPPALPDVSLTALPSVSLDPGAWLAQAPDMIAAAPGGGLFWLALAVGGWFLTAGTASFWKS